MKTLFDSDVRYYGGSPYNTYAIKNGQVYIYAMGWVMVAMDPAMIEIAFSSCEVPDEWRSTLEAS